MKTMQTIVSLQTISNEKAQNKALLSTNSIVSFLRREPVSLFPRMMSIQFFSAVILINIDRKQNLSTHDS